MDSPDTVMNEAAAPLRSGGSRRSSRPEGDLSERARDDLLRRVPPHSEEAEQAVLSGVFLRPDLLQEIIDQLRDTDFYIPAHRIIFGAFIALAEQNIPVDEVTVFDWLANHSQLEAAGGAAYLGDLSRAVVSGANAAHWAKIVRDKAIQRTLIETSAQIISNCYDSTKDVPTLLDESERAVFSISERANSKTFSSSSELVRSVFDELLARYNNKSLTTGVPTGYMQLDKMTAGLQPTDLIILAARPSMGKTAFALNVAMRAALSGGATVAVFSLEMSKESLMDRMLCAWGRVELSRVRRGFLEDEDWAKLSAAADALSSAKIFIDDTAGLTPLALRARCRRLKAEHGLDLVMVDYLQLMHSARNDSRELEISDISRNLKALAKELKVPVIALSQLNRKVEERTDKRPVLSDLRESGAIEQDADLIMFIHREDAYNKKGDRPKTGIAEIIIGKHRNGPTGTVELAYRPEFTAFDDLETTYIEPSESQPG
ncbi:replicative DNA helicase [Mailhella massiliensis]|uniref:Replicative DNA helicase n=1 Tax=Mailhella massiliensis TaxID=1903261 RepID=A0A921DSZ3_9BACT|nr:replicative DNA helicase [Mailhella massiliensis]HJD97532.1 replicative DNA helicase [Mailhella massiliensis]